MTFLVGYERNIEKILDKKNMLKTVSLIYAQHGEDAAKREVGGRTLNDHGNYIVDHGKSWKNHGVLFLNFCGNP